MVQLAVRAKVTQGRELRLDGICVQTEIHHWMAQKCLSRLERMERWLDLGVIANNFKHIAQSILA